ncbi:hypothetical protein [Actinomadura harenae]|uniref:Uncharacterized protein n=1 Tax=Actinomadura harenae TaxID=2483351 RepID=A0A3M2LSZ9_9ACTN|nr:hypothetical protein [Actinomadura harenae]RMI40604.1 hypothetical protein EBO15_26120 [Actinomadura harenae]
MAFNAANALKAAVAVSTAAMCAGMALPAYAFPAESAPVKPGPARSGWVPIPPKDRGHHQRGLIRTGTDPEAKTRRPHARAAAGEHVLKVDVLDRDGKSPSTDRANRLYIWPLNGDEPLHMDVVNGHAEGPVPDGAYIVDSKIHDVSPGGRTSTVLLYNPKVTVKGDTTLTLDGRTARPIRVTADRADAATLFTAAAVSQRIGGRFRSITLLLGDDNYVTPAAPGGELELDVLAQLTKGGAAEGSPYIYNISSSFQGIPADPTARVRTSSLAEIRTRYAGAGGRACSARQSSPFWKTDVQLLTYGKVALSGERTEYYTPGVEWYDTQAVTDASCDFTAYDFYQRQERFDTGKYTRSWGQGPFGPAQGTFTPDTEGQNLIQVPLQNSTDADTLAGTYSFVQGDTKLTNASGSVVALSGIPGYLDGWEPAKPGKYTLTVNAKRSAPWSDLSSQQHITWNVKVTDQKATLPLGVVRYKVPGLDAGNRAVASSLQTVSLTPDGLTTGTTPKLWTSTDDGATWKPAPVIKDGTGWKAAFRNPAKGYVSLRTQVNGIVDQTLIRAYGVR